MPLDARDIARLRNVETRSSPENADGAKAAAAPPRAQGPAARDLGLG